MKTLISNLKTGFIQLETKNIEIVACCCGHGKYPMTIIISDNIEEEIRDLCSDTIIPRKKRFYKKDKQGYYYIPETIKK